MSRVIPPGALEQHIAVLGKTGSGKSYAVRGAVVEPLLDDGARVCVVDPTGAWNGLRSSASGKHAGYPVVIFGGAHADLPLGAAHGEAIAEVIGTSSTPSIIDTSLMKVGERTRFFADFADALLRKNRGPLHLVIDESHLFMPQGRVSDPQSGAMLHAANNMVSLGRSRGLRIVMITQRPAKLHKDSLTQAETLIALRLIAPQDRAAVEAWIEDNADEKKAREILSSLAGLKTGQGWIWAPELELLERVSFPRIKTFDSGRSPDGSEPEAKVLAPIDVEAISSRLEKVSAAAVADDPKKLRARIAELERQAHGSGIEKQRVDVRTIEQAEERGFEAGKECILREVRGLRETITAAIDKALGDPHFGPVNRHPDPFLTKAAFTGFGTKAPTHPVVERSISITRINGSDGGARRRISIALAQNEEGLAGKKLAILSGVKEGGSTWRGAMAGLRKDGHVQDDGRFFRLTATGLKALGPYEPLPTGRDLVDYWRGKFSGTRLALFEAILAGEGEGVPSHKVAAAAGVELGGSTWRGHMAKLRGLELVSGSDELRAAGELFQ